MTAGGMSLRRDAMKVGQRFRPWTSCCKRVLVGAVSFGLGTAVLAATTFETRAQTTNKTASFEVVPPIGHSQEISSTAISGDERILATAGGDGLIKVWEVQNARLLRTIQTYSPNFTKVISLSSGGDRLLGIANHSYKVWDTRTGREIVSLDGPNAPIYGGAGSDYVKLSASGNRVLAIGEKIIRIWDVNSGKPVSAFPNNASSVDAIQLSGDGSLAASGGPDGSIRIWDTTTGRETRTLSAHPDSVTVVRFTPAGGLFRSQSKSELKVWNAETGQLVWSHAIAERSSVLFAADWKQLVSVASNWTVQVWDAYTGTRQWAFTREKDIGLFLDIAPNKRDFMFAGNGVLSYLNPSNGQISRTVKFDGEIIRSSKNLLIVRPNGGDTLQVRSRETGALLRTVGDQCCRGQAVAISPSGARTATLAASGSVTLRDSRSGRPLGTCASGTDSIGGIDVSPNDRWIAATGKNNLIRICDAMSGETIQTIRQQDRVGEKAVFAPNSDRILSRDEHGAATVWDIGSGRLIRSIAGSANVVAFTHDGKNVLTGTENNQIHVWELMRGREVRNMRMRIGPVLSMAVSQDGRRIAAGSIVGIKLFDAENGKELRKLEIGNRHEVVGALAFSRSESSTLAISYGSNIVLWNSDSGREVRKYNAGDGVVTALAFSDDGKRLLSAHDASVVKQWDPATGALLATFVSFSDDEWVTITPEGFFDASPNGAKQLSVVRGLQAYSIDQFYNQLYRPDLVREKLVGDPQGLVRESLAKLSLSRAVASGNAPQVTILAPAGAASVEGDQVVVDATIVDQGGGIGRIEWRVNGVTLGVEERGFGRVTEQGGPGDLSPTSEPPSVKVSRSLGISPGENRIAVLAYNAAGLIASEPVEIVVSSVHGRELAPPRLHVLALGVNDYWDSALRLNFAVADARALSEALTQAGSKLFQKVEITNLVDDQVTISKLDHVFTELGEKIRPQDVFVFFLAGHGKTVDARFYFLPHEFRYSSENSFVELGIGQDQFQKWFSRIKAQKSVLLFDACESGSLVGERTARRGIEEKTAIDRLTRAMGRTMLTATTDSKPAIEGYRGHGAFTYSVLAALGEGDGNKDGVIDVTELAQYVDHTLPNLTYKAFKLRQVPQMSIVGSSFPIATSGAFLTPPVGILNGASVPTKPTHVVVSPAVARQGADPTSPVVVELGAGIQVVMIEAVQGWALVAKEGRKLGYVDLSALLELR